MQKHFLLNVDYKNLLARAGDQKNSHGGTREEVWNETAYKTAGCLLKCELIMNKKGVIVSKKKFIQETNNNKFILCGVNKPNDV